MRGCIQEGSVPIERSGGGGKVLGGKLVEGEGVLLASGGL